MSLPPAVKVAATRMRAMRIHLTLAAEAGISRTRSTLAGLSPAGLPRAGTPTATKKAAKAAMTPHNRTLLDAAAHGDADAVRTALAAGADIEARDTRHRTALLLAARHDHVHAAEVLVAAGADPDAQDDRNDSAWLVTGVTGSVRMMRTLLPANPDLKLTNRYGGISLIPAAERGHVDYVRALLRETDTDVDHVNDLGWTALLEAVILGDGGIAHQEIVELLVTAGATPNLPDNNGTTALQHAQRRGFKEIAGLLQAVR